MANNSRATPELEQVIRNLIQEIMTESAPNNEDLVDEPITDRSNLAKLDKIPDIVRCLRDFSGIPAEYTAWKKSVDKIFEIYSNIRGTTKYFGIVSVVRNKIVGQANISLEAYNVPLNWNAIKKCLDTHYADKRDVGTLEYQLTNLVQGNNSIESFYEKVYSHFSLILNKISSNNYDRATSTVLIESYRNKALDTFIRGLNGDLPRLLAMREPTDLPQALYLYNKLANQNYRSNYANNNQKNQTRNLPVPSRHEIQRQFYPELTYFGRGNLPIIHKNHDQSQITNNYTNQPHNNYNRSQLNHNHPNHVNNNYQPNNNNQYNPTPNLNFPTQNYRNNPPPRPLAPKPLPRPEPMEVDQSVRSQQLNYANRPRIPYTGTNNNNQNHDYPPKKIQRNFHIEAGNEGSNSFNMSELEQCLSEETETQPLNEYIAQYYDTEQEHENQNLNYTDVSDVHFLG